jgi:hypothetical protein
VRRQQVGSLLSSVVRSSAWLRLRSLSQRERFGRCLVRLRPRLFRLSVLVPAVPCFDVQEQRWRWTVPRFVCPFGSTSSAHISRLRLPEVHGFHGRRNVGVCLQLHSVRLFQSPTTVAGWRSFVCCSGLRKIFGKCTRKKDRLVDGRELTCFAILHSAVEFIPGSITKAGATFENGGTICRIASFCRCSDAFWHFVQCCN